MQVIIRPRLLSTTSAALNFGHFCPLSFYFLLCVGGGDGDHTHKLAGLQKRGCLLKLSKQTFLGGVFVYW